MFPNPQDALPLAAQPTVAASEAHAHELARACAWAGPEAIRDWARAWVTGLAGLRVPEDHRKAAAEVERAVARVSDFATATLRPEGVATTCGLDQARHVLARAHGFPTWAIFVAHLDDLARPGSPVAAYEAAAEAIVTGDAGSLARLLASHADLIRTRSTREHDATLLHYVSANGVEGYRQRSPVNAAAITRQLLEAGAEVDAEANVYGGGCTALGLVATSAPPRQAGVQIPVIDVLLAHGARMDHPGSTGNGSPLIRGCLANGCPEAAEYLVGRGAPLDLMGAAGTGRMDAVRRILDARGGTADAADRDVREALGYASVYGRTEVVELFLDRGVPVDVELGIHGAGHTALHAASYHGSVEMVRALLRRGARVDVRDATWGTPPLPWALTGWGDARTSAERYHAVVAMLVGAGAEVKPEWLADEAVRADPRMRAALGG